MIKHQIFRKADTTHLPTNFWFLSGSQKTSSTGTCLCLMLSTQRSRNINIDFSLRSKSFTHQPNMRTSLSSSSKTRVWAFFEKEFTTKLPDLITAVPQVFQRPKIYFMTWKAKKRCGSKRIGSQISPHKDFLRHRRCWIWKESNKVWKELIILRDWTILWNAKHWIKSSTILS